MISQKSITFFLMFVCLIWQDFGDYSDSYYSVQTTEGEQISQLIAGYIDIILKKVVMFNCADLLNASGFWTIGEEYYIFIWLSGLFVYLSVCLFVFQKKAKDHLGLEGDEESTMYEHSVSPAT